MKPRKPFGSALLSLFVVGSVGTAPAQVVNPGFETAGASAAEAAGWTVTTAAGGPVSAVRTNSNPRSGSFHFEVYLASTGAGPVAQFEQANVPVTAGATYGFSFHARRLTGSAGDNCEWRILWNAGGDTGYQGFNPGNNTYAFISNSVTAPLAATSATLMFHFAGAAIPSQSARIQLDDVSLTTPNGGGGGVTNSPLQIAIVSGARISWFASNNVPYQVQWAADLNPDTPWNNLGGLTVGNGSSNAVFDAAGPPHNVYRVLSIQ